MAPVRPASLKVRALQWLAQREHSRQELRDKLLHLLQRLVFHRHALRPELDRDGAGHSNVLWGEHRRLDSSASAQTAARQRMQRLGFQNADSQ